LRGGELREQKVCRTENEKEEATHEKE
jgi:hypothetical protein